MGIVAKFTKEDVLRMLQHRVDKINASILFNLQVLGEECINNARKEGSYTDQTGNLRSSVGYIILSEGHVVKTGGFNQPYGQGGHPGMETGRQLALDIASKYNRGFALIVVAGMNYAAKVESMGKNVLSTAEHYAQAEMPRMVKELKLKIVA